MLQTDHTPGDVVFHATLQCPICDRAVYMTIDAATTIGRWVCLPCRVVGQAPCEIDESSHPPSISVSPVAIA